MNIIIFMLSALNLISSCQFDWMCSDTVVTSTVRPESCYTDKNCSLLYTFPAGSKSVNVVYNYSQPVAQEFYQNERLIASCEWAYTCNKTVQLHPEYKLYTAIIGPDDGLYEDLDIADVYNNTNSDDDIEDPVPHLMLFN